MRELDLGTLQNRDQPVGSIMLQLSGALILTAAEAAAEAKEQLLTHRGKLPDQAQAFDDGFALGLACVLQVGTMDIAQRCPIPDMSAHDQLTLV